MTMVLTSSGADRAAVVRFGQLITHGTCYNAGTVMSNVSVVLPFICAAQGMAWLAALLYPAYSIGAAVGNSVAPAILDLTRHHRHLVVAGAALVMAVLVTLNAAVSVVGSLAVTLLITSTAMGLASGVGNVAFTDLASNMLSDGRRGDLLLGQGAMGSVVATTITVLVVPMLGHDPLRQGVDLLLFGAAGLAIAGITAVFIEPVQTRLVNVRMSPLATIRTGLRVARATAWFRRYALTQLAFVPVALGSTFYSLRAAQAHDQLPVVVVVSSLALVVGARLWRAVYRRFGVRGMLTGSASASSAAAAGCLVAESADWWSSGWVPATVVALAVVGSQAVYTASVTWIGILADTRHRALLLGAGAALVALATGVVGALVGQIAVLYCDRWPGVVMLILSVVALAVARSDFGAPTVAERP